MSVGSVLNFNITPGTRSIDEHGYELIIQRRLHRKDSIADLDENGLLHPVDQLLTRDFILLQIIQPLWDAFQPIPD